MVQRLSNLSVVPGRATFLAPALLMSLMFSNPACAAAEPVDAAESEPVFSESNEPATTVNNVSLAAGYRFLTPDGPPTAAAPYERFKSGATGGFSAATLGSNLKLNVNGTFLHEDDYQSELAFDYRGFVRLQASSEAMWHNLLREQIYPGTQLFLNELDPGETYGVRTTTTQARARIKLGNNPFHLNLGYWELRRHGSEQLRFSDHYWSADPQTLSGSIITQANHVDRITREGTVGVDAHLGPVDFSYGFRIRDFSNRAEDPRYDFNINAFGALVPGIHAHDVIPDSRVASHTFKLFSDMSGGLVASGVYTLTERENRGGHGEAVPSERPSDVIHLAAGDFSYTPSKSHSVTLKYRHQEIERTTPSALSYPFAAIKFLNPAPSTSRDVVTASVIFRPYPRMIYRLEYNADLESRDGVRDAQAPLESSGAYHSDSRLTHTGTTSFYWRPASGLKLNGSYSYAACDNPTYRASFSDRHTGKLLLTYTKTGKWGVTGSYLVQHANGESSASVTPPPATDLFISTGNDPSSHLLPRQSRSNSATAGVWFSPLERLTITTSYSFLESEINQTALLTELSRNALAATRYLSTSHVYGIDANYAVTELLDLSLSLQQVFSKAFFDVPLITPFSATDSFGATQYNSTGITGLTRLDTTETGLSARADWRATPHLGCVLDYSFRVYDSGNVAYDGSVHTTMISLKARW
ncbi:hypothetical protein [Pelotalea chapellei]|uniref:Outer membrane beta-barrel protein n=1 Tax=Pelotalea chapellei TaxID=44671 RepID=A0ABS5U978_9BACT|nr:hypothetical protein [Pelotalea chapellei]MBT1072222.1 hypothetical protein [Pelotalea chapellei]